MARLYLRSGYGINGAGSHKMTDVDMFTLAKVAEIKYRQEGKLADDQRLLDLKHVTHIANDIRNGTVMGFWFPIIGFDDTVEVVCDEHGFEYIDIPEDEEELKEFSKHISFIDAQHRVWAFTSKYHLRDVINCCPVCACVLINPTKAEMIKAFLELNGKCKTMDKNLLLDFSAKIGALDDDMQEAYDLLSMLDEDRESPLYHRIDWGNRGKAPGNYKAKTIVELAVGTSAKKRETGFIAIMNEYQYKSTTAKYKVLFDHMKQALAIENTADTTFGDTKRKKLNNQQIAYIFRMCAESVALLHAEGCKQMTPARLAAAYKYIAKEALGQDHIGGSKYCPMHIINGRDQYSEELYDRWGGRANVDKAFLHDFRWVRMKHAQMMRSGGKVVAR